MRVYISGKIGEEVISEATRLKFARAEEMLRAKGYEVFNPCDETWQGALYMNWKVAEATVGVGGCVSRYGYYLLKDLQKLAVCDAVCFLDDWRWSPGAKAEYYFAKATGKRMFFQDWYDAREYLFDRMCDEAIAAGKRIDATGGERYKLENDYITNHIDEVWLLADG